MRQLLSDSSAEVRINASAAVCNLVLAFSACRSESLKNGGVSKLAELTRASQPELRCNAIWALRNLVYEASEDIKSEVLHLVGKETWEALLSDPFEELQVQTMIVLRNIVSKNASLLVSSELIDCRQMLLDKLTTENTEMRRQCLFVICHICAHDSHRWFGMDPALLAHIRHGLVRGLLQGGSLS